MRLPRLAAIVAILAGAPLAAQSIAAPTADYKAATTLFSIPGSTFGTHTQLSAGGMTLSFSVSGNKRIAAVNGWGTWASAPESERVGGLDVLYFNTRTLTMTLSQKVGIFGFEAEPNPFATHSYTASFYDGAALVGSVTRSVNGNAGSRLFAYEGAGFDRVVFSGSADFAAGAFRYAPTATVPEPGTYALMAAGLVGLIALNRRRKS